MASLVRPAVGCGPESCLVTWYGAQGDILSTLVRHHGTRFTADRVLQPRSFPQPTLIHAREDGAFRVFHGYGVTPVSRTGEPGATTVWHSSSVVLGSIVTWRGRLTAVYSRTSGSRTPSHVFANEFGARARSVRH